MSEIAPNEVVKCFLRDRRRLRALAEPLTITTPRLAAAPYADFADAMLHLAGKRDWRWRDYGGQERPGRSLIGAGAALAVDTLALPPFLAFHAAQAWRCLKTPLKPKRPLADGKPLYLRMDHLFDLKSGGSLAHTAGVIKALRQLSGSLAILSTDHLATVEEDADFHILTPRYRVGRNLPLLPTLSYSRQAIAWWLRRAASTPPFIYARYSTGNYTAAELRRRLAVPYVCEYNGSSVWIARHWDGKPLPFEPLFKLVEDVNLRCADVVVAVSEASRQELVARGIDDGRILVNPNGVDADIYHPDVDGAPLRQRYGIRADEIVIGFIGTFGRWHGVEVLADAFARLLAMKPGLRATLRLLLVGDGMTMAETRARLAAGDAVERTVFTGIVPQADGPAHLAACDILVSPHVPNSDNSAFFGSPTKLFEYMAMGRSIIASDLAQIGEILTHEKTALLTPPGDIEALAQGIGRLVESPDLRQGLALASRKEALARYTWLKHTQRILDRLAALPA